MLFQNFEAGVSTDMLGMKCPPPKTSDPTSNCSFLQETQVPGLCNVAKNDSVKFVTFWERRFHVFNFSIWDDAVNCEYDQRVSMLYFDSARMTFKTLVELNRDSLSFDTLRMLVF